MVFLHNSSTPHELSPQLHSHSFWSGPYKITTLISEMTSKICEIETNKKFIIHYDRIKPCHSSPGGFVSPTNTPPAPMQPLMMTPFNSSIAKCHSCFCEAHIACTPTVDPVSVSCSAPVFRPSPQTTFVWPLVANDNLDKSFATMEEDTFPNRSTDPTLPYSSDVREVLNSSNCSFNTAVSSTSPLDNSTTSKTVTKQQLLTDALSINASSRMTTLSPVRRFEHNCPLYYAATLSIKEMPPLNTSAIINSHKSYTMNQDSKQREKWDPVVTPLKQRSLYNKRLHANVQSIANSISAH